MIDVNVYSELPFFTHGPGEIWEAFSEHYRHSKKCEFLKMVLPKDYED